MPSWTRTCAQATGSRSGTAQSCHAGDTVSTVYLVADNYAISQLIDDINVNGKTFSSASDNANGDNTAAGPGRGRTQSRGPANCGAPCFSGRGPRPLVPARARRARRG